MTQFLLPKVRKRPRRQKPNDDAFLDWVRRQPSCIDGTFSEFVDGEGRTLACHVRRASTSGTAFKPLYSAVPMTDAQHKLQHQHGEHGLLNRTHPHVWDRVSAARWFDNQAAKYRAEWFRMHPEARP